MTVREKVCVACGRRIIWRKKWERSWDEVRYCSTTCRRRGVTGADHDLEDRLLELLRSRPRGSLLALTELPEADPEPARRAARRLVESGEVELIQRGRVVDPSTAKGPVSVRLLRRSP